MLCFCYYFLLNPTGPPVARLATTPRSQCVRRGQAHRISMAIGDTLSAQAAQRPEPALRNPQPSPEDGPEFASFMGSQDETQSSQPRSPPSANPPTKSDSTKSSRKPDAAKAAANTKKTDPSQAEPTLAGQTAAPTPTVDPNAIANASATPGAAPAPNVPASPSDPSLVQAGLQAITPAALGALGSPASPATPVAGINQPPPLAAAGPNTGKTAAKPGALGLPDIAKPDAKIAQATPTAQTPGDEADLAAANSPASTPPTSPL